MKQKINRRNSAKKELLINVSLLILVLAACFLTLFLVHKNLNQKRETEIKYLTGGEDYALCFVNREGERISALNGSLKLMIDPFTIFRNYPNQKTRHFSIDSYGFRGGFDENNKSRIIIIGGSTAFGEWLDNDNESFSARLEQLNPLYEVINAGVVGFLSGQELAYLVHYLIDYNPKMIIVFDGWNDLNDIYFPIPREENPTFGVNNNFNFIEARLTEYNRFLTKEVGEVKKPLITMSEDELFREAYSTYTENLLKMSLVAKSIGARFVVVFQPELVNKRYMTAEEKENLKHYRGREIDFGEKYAEMIEYAKKALIANNITYININNEPAYSEINDTLFVDTVHLNAKGHFIIAKILSDYLSKK